MIEVVWKKKKKRMQMSFCPYRYQDQGGTTTAPLQTRNNRLGGSSEEKDLKVGVDMQLDVNQQGYTENSKHHAEACKEHHHI